MKKSLCILLTVFMLFAFVGSAMASPSNSMEAYGLYGLYIKRYIGICNYLHQETPIFAALPEVRIEDSISGSSYEINTPTINMTVDKKTNKVTEVNLIYYSSSFEYESNFAGNIRAIALYSALEYNEKDEIYTANSAQVEANIAVNDWSANMMDAIKNAMLKSSTSEILIYSGNYDYYIDYFKTSDGADVFFFIARER